MKKPAHPYNHIAQQLAASLSQRQRERGWRVIWLTSTGSQHGKSTLCKLLLPTLNLLSDMPWRCINIHDLMVMSPEQIASSCWLLDGPAIDAQLLAMHRHLVERIDAAIILVMIRRSRQDELQDATQLVRALGIELGGVILNEHIEPALGLKFKRLYRRLTAPFKAKPQEATHELV